MHKRVWIIGRLEQSPWYARWPLKAALLGLTVLIVCNPYPRLFWRQLGHLADPNRLVDAQHPAVVDLAAEMRRRLAADGSPKEALRGVEKLVHERLRYAWDWNTWGIADYWPTAGEALAAGREDCDGRAVVAASVLRALGFHADLVTDFAHVWVTTDHGDTMGPGKTRAVVAGEEGVSLRTLPWRELPGTLAYGIAVFPLRRELVILVVWWLLMCGGCGWARRLTALAAMLVGLLLLRRGSHEYHAPLIGEQLVAAAALAAGVCVLLYPGPRRAVGSIERAAGTTAGPPCKGNLLSG